MNEDQLSVILGTILGAFIAVVLGCVIFLTAEKDVKAAMFGLKLDEPKNKVWKPELKEYYYAVSFEGITVATTWENDVIDLTRWHFGNVFKTEKEAKRKVEKMKLEAEIERWIAENDPESFELDWNDYDSWKYCVVYDHNNDKCFVTFSLITQQDLKQYFFSSKNNAEAFIDHFGDRLKLLLRGKVD